MSTQQSKIIGTETTENPEEERKKEWEGVGYSLRPIFAEDNQTVGITHVTLFNNESFKGQYLPGVHEEFLVVREGRFTYKYIDEDGATQEKTVGQEDTLVIGNSPHEIIADKGVDIKITSVFAKSQKGTQPLARTDRSFELPNGHSTYIPKNMSDEQAIEKFNELPEAFKKGL